MSCIRRGKRSQSRSIILFPKLERRRYNTHLFQNLFPILVAGESDQAFPRRAPFHHLALEDLRFEHDVVAGGDFFSGADHGLPQERFHLAQEEARSPNEEDSRERKPRPERQRQARRPAYATCGQTRDSGPACSLSRSTEPRAQTKGRRGRQR